MVHFTEDSTLKTLRVRWVVVNDCSAEAVHLLKQQVYGSCVGDKSEIPPAVKKVVANGLLGKVSVRTKYLQILQDIGPFLRIGFSAQIGGLIEVDCIP